MKSPTEFEWAICSWAPTNSIDTQNQKGHAHYGMIAYQRSMELNEQMNQELKRWAAINSRVTVNTEKLEKLLEGWKLHPNVTQEQYLEYKNLVQSINSELKSYRRELLGRPSQKYYKKVNGTSIEISKEERNQILRDLEKKRSD